MEYFTEEEAKEKWCPFASAHPAAQMCIASDCMAWRKSTYQKQDGREDQGLCGIPNAAPDR